MRFVYLFLFIPYLLRAQESRWSSTGWQELTISDGLSQGMIFDMKQDRKGFLWIATKDGLNRYDGYNFKAFSHDPYNEFSLSDNACSALLIDRQGRLWIGTQTNGLNLYDDRSGRFYHITISNLASANASNYDIRLLAEDPEGNIWIGTHVGRPFKLKLPASLQQGFPEQANFTNQVQCIPVQIAREESNVSNLYFGFSPDGQAITGIQGSVYAFNWKTPTSLTSLNLFEGTTPGIIDLHKDYQRDFLFVSTNNQLLGWHQGRKKTIRFPNQTGLGPKIDNYDENKLAIINDRYLWLVSAEELFARDSLTIQDAFVTLPPNIFQVTKTLKDQSGNIWIGTGGYGLRKFNPAIKQFHGWLPTTSLSNLYVDQQARVYARFLYAYGQIDKVNNRLVPFLDSNLPPPDQRQRNMIQDRQGFFWVSNVNFETHENQLFKFSADWKLLKKFPLPKGLAFGFIGNQTLQDKRGNLWITCVNGKLLRVNPQTERFTLFSFQHLLPQSGAEVETYALLSEADSVFWIGTQKGLVRASKLTGNPSFTIYKNSVTDRRSLSNDFVLSLAPDPYEPKRYLWIGTKGGGLERLDKQTGHFNHFTEAQGLPNKVVYGILSDESKNLWLSTNRGLAKFNPKSFLFRNYTKADGLQDDEFNTNSYVKTPTGELLFGGVNGLTSFHPSSLKGKSNQRPRVTIIGLKVNNKAVEAGDPSAILAQPIEQTQELELQHNQNLLSFEFAVMDYTNVGKNRFRYRLEGIDHDWIEAGTNRFANYAQLPYGAYTFQVTGSTDNEVWSHPVTVRIQITPPFYRSWWAYLLYCVVLGIVAWLVHRFQSQRLLLQQQVAFEQKEAHRLAELDSLKTQFFANISHEFRTPLTLILGPLANRKKRLVGETELSMMERNAQRLLRLINQLLDLAKLEAGQLRTVYTQGDMAAFLRTLASSFTSLAESRQILFTFRQNQEVQWAEFDRDKLEMIVTNLLSNAFKFTPAGRSVIMKVAYAADSGKRMVYLTIQDAGIGITAEELPRIFDRFYQPAAEAGKTNSIQSYEGTGIGLALVKELVDVLGGAVTVDSMQGVGTSFLVTLPLRAIDAPEDAQHPPAHPWSVSSQTSAEQTSAKQTSAEQTHPWSVSSQTRAETTPGVSRSDNLLLIIDDNADIRAYIRSIFSEEYQILEATDGRQGLEMATESVPNLVICDLMMPRLDGFGFCRELKKQIATSHIPVVMLTAKATVEDRIEGFELGADDYLTKPFNQAEIQVRVRNLLEKQARLQQYFGGWIAVDKPIEPAPSATKEEQFIDRLHEIIDEHLTTSKFGILQLSEAMGMSQSQLVRKLKALTNQTGVEFIRNHRLALAAERLKKGESVSDVAYLVGFESLSYFTRSFQEKYGVLPSAYTNGHEKV